MATCNKTLFVEHNKAATHMNSQQLSQDAEDLMRSSQPATYQGLPLDEELLAMDNGVVFLQVCDPWKVIHFPVDGSNTHAHIGSTKWTQWV